MPHWYGHDVTPDSSITFEADWSRDPYGDFDYERQKRLRGTVGGGFDWKNILPNVKRDAGLLMDNIEGLIDYIPSAPFPAAESSEPPIDDFISKIFGSDAPMMKAIAWGESKMDPLAHDPQLENEDSVGLFQVNWLTWGKKEEYKALNKELNPILGRDLRRADLFDPKINIIAAKIILDRQGFYAWYNVYRKILKEST